MWHLPIPDDSDWESDIDKVLNLSTSDKKNLKNIYSKYHDNKGEPDSFCIGNDMSEKTRNDIYNSYEETYEKRKLFALRSRLLLNVYRCPRCSISVADQLDHYLPRSKYKPLSIYSRNLIPICSKCNLVKSNLVDPDPANRFIHAYYNLFANSVKFLDADINIVDNALMVGFTINDKCGLPDIVIKRYRFHMLHLKLNDRLKKEINVLLIDFSVPFEIVYKAGGAAAIKDFLFQSKENYSKQFGLNDWRTSLLDALVNHKVFCDGGFKDVIEQIQIN